MTAATCADCPDPEFCTEWGFCDVNADRFFRRREWKAWAFGFASGWLAACTISIAIGWPSW